MNEVTLAAAAVILVPVGALMIKLFQAAMTWQAQINAEKERTIARKDQRIEELERRVDELQARARTTPP